MGSTRPALSPVREGRGFDVCGVPVLPIGIKMSKSVRRSRPTNGAEIRAGKIILRSDWLGSAELDPDGPGRCSSVGKGVHQGWTVMDPCMALEQQVPRR